MMIGLMMNRKNLHQNLKNLHQNLKNLLLSVRKSKLNLFFYFNDISFQDSDDEDNSSFGLPTKPSQSIIKPDNDFDDKSSTTSDKPEEPEPSKPKALSELEKAVLRRRKQMGDPDIPANDNDDDDDDGFVKKPAATKAKTSSNEPSSSTM